jgi:hypothetical protein
LMQSPFALAYTAGFVVGLKMRKEFIVPEDVDVTKSTARMLFVHVLTYCGLLAACCVHAIDWHHRKILLLGLKTDIAVQSTMLFPYVRSKSSRAPVRWGATRYPRVWIYSMVRRFFIAICARGTSTFVVLEQSRNVNGTSETRDER